MLVIVYSSYIHMHTHTHTHSLINLTSAQDSQVMWLYYRYVYIVIMPRGGATAYGSRVVCVSVCLSVRSIFYKTAQNQLLKTATLA